MTDHGIIISPWDSITLERVGNKYGAQQMKNSLYIAGPQKKMVDGAIFEGVVYPVGRIKHGNETMHCYADSVELAERLTGKH